MKFPRLVYKSASTHKLVASADEHAAALADDWFASVPEAQGVKALAPAPTPVQVEDLGTKELPALDYDKTAAAILAGKYTVDYCVPQMASLYNIPQDEIRAELLKQLPAVNSTERRTAVTQRRIDAEKAAAVKGKKDKRRLVNRREADEPAEDSRLYPPSVPLVAGSIAPPWGV